jgi:MFS family permease
MSKPFKHNEPLGLDNIPARTSASTIETHPRNSISPNRSRSRSGNTGDHGFRFNVQPPPEEKKKTASGIILEPQPEESENDPLNWKKVRRDVALLSLGFYCMIGGGMTPVLAAGFTNVAASYGVPVAQVSLTTGFYMLGLGLGSVIVSPTAIIFGKRPVYLVGVVLFIISAIWCAASPNYPSLVVARIFQGLSLAPCEALPSATIAEIYFLHERAYRLGIYTLLLLGGKNLIPLVSAAIIEALSWQWVFWIIAMFGGFSAVLLFLFVPETFWDRTPTPRIHNHHHVSRSVISVISHILTPGGHHHSKDIHNHAPAELTEKQEETIAKLQVPNLQVPTSGRTPSGTIAERRRIKSVGFANEPKKEQVSDEDPMAKIYIDHTNDPYDDQPKSAVGEIYGARTPKTANPLSKPEQFQDSETEHEDNAEAENEKARPMPPMHRDSWRVVPHGHAPKTPDLHNFNSPSYQPPEQGRLSGSVDNDSHRPVVSLPTTPPVVTEQEMNWPDPAVWNYTQHHRERPRKTFVETLKPWNGRLRKDNWLRAAVRPFILFAYPAILWSSLVYALSVGWLIVLSESVAVIYRNKETYNFNALQTGLVYLSPFIGGVLGTAVAGKVSDVIVRAMARKNDGVYEPEFRLVMAFPIMITTCIGLMGFGWSAEIHDAWIVPTILFGVISFGCSLGSTTAITFAVDSYRIYAGEALVTLNFSKSKSTVLTFLLLKKRS